MSQAIMNTPSISTVGANNTHASTLDDVSEISNRILGIVYEYALDKFENTAVKHAAGHPKFMSVVSAYVADRKPVLMCLPAFPFKSANKAYKVFGILPDKADELALARLNTMCERIAAVYKPGAKLTIISDGLVYNDLLCVPDRDVWAYGEALRAMAVDKDLTHLEFSRLKDLSDMPLPEKLEEILYVANATNFRRHLLNRWGKDDIDIEHEIATKLDTLMTYRGYSRFLRSDLQHVFPSACLNGRSAAKKSSARSMHTFKKNVKFLAKEMLIRGYAFAGACKAAFPNHLRLSIHQSTGEHKVSLSLLDTKTGYTTPWHCSVALMADGQWLSAPMGDFKENPLMEVVYEDGRPSYFRQRLPQSLPLAMPIAETADAFIPNGPPSDPAISSPFTSDDSMSDPLASSGTLSEDALSEPLTSSVTSESVSDRDGGCESKIPTAGKPVLSAVTVKEEAGRVSTASNEYGKRLIPHILDDLASTDPDRVIYSVAKSADVSQGMLEISALGMAQAVNKTSWWLYDQIGDSEATTSSPQTVGYIGPHDLRYVLLTYACIKAGHEILFLSPKNSVEGAVAVLKAAGCSFWAQPTEEPLSRLIESCLTQHPMVVLNLPTVDELLDADAASVKHFPYDKTWEEAADETFCVLHTSGSTGLPKPMRWSHALIGTMDAVRLLPPAEGDFGLAPWTSLFEERDTIYSSFPMSHGAGTIMDIMIPSYFAMHCVLGPAGVIPNMDLTASLADHAKIDVWSMVPTLVDELGETPDVLAKFKSAKFICASGGPTNQVSASKVNEVVRVLNLTGTTEGLFIGNLVVEREDWRYFAFHPYSGFEFRPVGDGDEYEHWCVRNQHGPLFQGIFHTFPDKAEVNLKDLYIKHPTKPGHWAFKGRSDDVVVLSNGYKISPLETEALMTSHPAIDGCLVVGTAQPHAGLLIELKDPVSMLPASKELLDSIWEMVRQANTVSMHKDQLQRDHIMFAEADKPFVRTDKRTVKRKDTLALYADYIDRYYHMADPEMALSVTVDTSSAESVAAAVREVVASVMALPEVPDDEADLFHLGLDSLRVFGVIRALQGAMPGLQDLLAPRHLYANPTVSKFAAVVARLVQGAETGAGDTVQEEKLAKMIELLDKYKTRSSLKMTGFDQMMPHLHGKLLFYLPLRPSVSFEHAFAQLQGGLSRTISLVPTLDYLVAETDSDDARYRPGQLEMVPPDHDSDHHPRQLVYRDLSKILPCFGEMRAANFMHPAATEELLCDAPFYPSLPADIFRAQANFVDGGCLLVMCFHHSALDGNGTVTVLRAWAESCRFLQGDQAATCDWLDPESMNRALPQASLEAEGYTDGDESDIDPAVWDHIAFPPPAGACEDAFSSTSLAPAFRPAPGPDARTLNTTMFIISADKMAQLEADVAADQSVLNGSPPSASDIIQALFWRATIRARHAVAATQPPDDATSILEQAVDGRPYFSTILPATYMGNLMIVNRISVPLASLVGAPPSSPSTTTTTTTTTITTTTVSPTTRSMPTTATATTTSETSVVSTSSSPSTSSSMTIAEVASLIRERNSTLIRPRLFHDAFVLVQSQEAVPDYNQLKYAFMQRDGFGLCITNLMLFQTGEVLNFGGDVFGGTDTDQNGGGPVALRMLHGVQNAHHRLVVVLPQRQDGGVEFLLGTFPEEKEAMVHDGEWMRYARLM
ncbi:Pyoverdine/dityrosine biosynthesis protein-domain-containing protein [Apodospora peruviana]|uniref:Pyoverdine/dityrosine biosynthesis protein-domain-containing protein n=1 Tax=Apodospora peruviana TaxID=516989 RepID=A0AAE0HZH0_9PEZI|nr:Pyoverdine/dityrosine biosynthesis protein-domain-containing protein [Apodospora peruviana]